MNSTASSQALAQDAETILIFGNSGSGKSSLAKQYAELYGLSHLDLDTIAWQPTSPPLRTPISDADNALRKFTQQNKKWVIEGCYADLFYLIKSDIDLVIFLDLPVVACIENAKRRPWEPHKYASKEQQDANLPMLIEWIREYESRDDEFSRRQHSKFFDQYSGKKIRMTANP